MTITTFRITQVTAKIIRKEMMFLNTVNKVCYLFLVYGQRWERKQIQFLKIAF